MKNFFEGLNIKNSSIDPAWESSDARIEALKMMSMALDAIDNHHLGEAEKFLTEAVNKINEYR